MIGKIYEPSEYMNESTNAATKAVRTDGSTTVINARIGVAPNVRAASTHSLGNRVKGGNNTKTTNGIQIKVRAVSNAQNPGA